MIGLVFTVLLITKILTFFFFFAAQFFLPWCCFLLLVILQALMTWSWSHAVLPVLVPWVLLAVTGAVPAWSGLNLTVFCFFRQVLVWVWFDFIHGISPVWQQQHWFLRAFLKIALVAMGYHSAQILWCCPSGLCPFAVLVMWKATVFASWET